MIKVSTKTNLIQMRGCMCCLLGVSCAPRVTEASPYCWEYSPQPLPPRQQEHHWPQKQPPRHPGQLNGQGRASVNTGFINEKNARLDPNI